MSDAELESMAKDELVDIVLDIQQKYDDLETRVDGLEQQRIESTHEVSYDFRDHFEDDLEIVTGTDEQSERATIRQAILDAINNFEAAYEEAAPIDYVREMLVREGYDTGDVPKVLKQLRREGVIYEPEDGRVKVV